MAQRSERQNPSRSSLLGGKNFRSLHALRTRRKFTLNNREWLSYSLRSSEFWEESRRNERLEISDLVSYSA